MILSFSRPPTPPPPPPSSSPPPAFSGSAIPCRPVPRATTIYSNSISLTLSYPLASSQSIDHPGSPITAALVVVAQCRALRVCYCTLLAVRPAFFFLSRCPISQSTVSRQSNSSRSSSSSSSAHSLRIITSTTNSPRGDFFHAAPLLSRRRSLRRHWTTAIHFSCNPTPPQGKLQHLSY
jgi:hypothetical protein